MKHIKFLIILFAVSSLFATCLKEKLDSNGLPPATQQGKNTLGFLLNGKPWTPKGVRGTGNLSIDYDAGFENGIFNIVAYDFDATIARQLVFAIRDSLNYINAPASFELNSASLFSVSYNYPCDYFTRLSDVTSSGNLKIQKLDRNSRIIAGTFQATMIKPNCDTIQITEGRFDMKF